MKHSASRALALIRAMNARPVSAVGELARETGISKPSVVRLLAILIEDGFVQRASRPGSYSLTRQILSLSTGFRDDTMLARAAAPVMQRLTGEIEWPTALGVFEAGAMVVRHSTIPFSPLAWYRTTLYLRLGLLGSAMGQIFLASCDASTRANLLDAYDNNDVSPAEKSEEHFELVRARGYGLRAASADHPTISISVPIIVRESISGALSATIYARAMPVEQAVERYLDRLQAAAAEIVAGMTGSVR